MNNQKPDLKIRKKLIGELGIENLSEKQQQEIILQLDKVVLEEIFLAMLEKLDKASQIKFKELLEKNENPQEVDNFLREKISNYEKLVEEKRENLIREFRNSLD